MPSFDFTSEADMVALKNAIDVTARYLVPDFGNFFFYLAVILVVCAFPRGLMGRAQ